MKYRQEYDGEWIRPARKGYKIKCCDCGLVHKINFRIRKGNIEYQPFRDNRATAAVRRKIKKPVGTV